MPYPIEVNDTRGVVWYHYTSGEFADMIVDQFDEMLTQSERQPLVCPISLQRTPRWCMLATMSEPFVTRPYRLWWRRPRSIVASVTAMISIPIAGMA